MSPAAIVTSALASITTPSITLPTLSFHPPELPTSRISVSFMKLIIPLLISVSAESVDAAVAVITTPPPLDGLNWNWFSQYAYPNPGL